MRRSDGARATDGGGDGRLSGPEGDQDLGGATSSAWTTGTNWSGNTVPVAGDDVVITSAGTNAPTLSASRSIGSLSFTGTKTLTLANTGTVLTVTGVVPTTTFGVNFTGTGDVITGTGTINAANGINVATGGSATITVGANGLTVTGVLSKVGTGTLALSLPSSSDVLALTSAGSSVTSVTFTGSSRTLQLGANATLTVDNQAALSGGANNLITLGGPNSALTGLAGFTFGSTGTIPCARTTLRGNCRHASGALHGDRRHADNGQHRHRHCPHPDKQHLGRYAAIQCRGQHSRNTHTQQRHAEAQRRNRGTDGLQSLRCSGPARSLGWNASLAR